MTTIARRADAWLFSPAPPERLAVFRVLVGAFATLYLAIRAPAFASLTDVDASRFEPVGVLAWLGGPLPDWTLQLSLALALLFGLAFTAGLWFRATGPAFAIVLLGLTTYRSCWGQLLWFENLMVLHVLIVGFSRSADALAVGRHQPHLDEVRCRVRYGWPVRLAALVMVLTYVLAGIAKLRIGGLDWMFSDSLRNHVAYSAARLGVLGGSSSPIAGPLVERGWIFVPLAVWTVVLELGAPLALTRRFRGVWVVCVWLLHVGIAASMYVVFPYPMSLVAFAPLFPLERLTRYAATVRRTRG